MRVLDDKISRPVPEDEVFEIPINEIYADEDFNCRGFIDPMTVFELARQIKDQGLLQPITVQPYDKKPGKKWRIIAGYRRHEAHRMNDATHIRGLVRNTVSDQDARLLNLSENIQREDLTIDQEAKGINHLILGGWTQSQIAKRIGKSPKWVKTRTDFLELPKWVQEDIVTGAIPHAEISAIAGLLVFGDDAVTAYVKRVKDAKLAGREARKFSPHKDGGVSTSRSRNSEEIYDLQEAIQDSTGNVMDPIAIALGWAAGVVSDDRMNGVIKDYVREKYNKHYIEPAYA